MPPTRSPLGELEVAAEGGDPGQGATSVPRKDQWRHPLPPRSLDRLRRTPGRARLSGPLSVSQPSGRLRSRPTSKVGGVSSSCPLRWVPVPVAIIRRPMSTMAMEMKEAAATRADASDAGGGHVGAAVARTPESGPHCLSSLCHPPRGDGAVGEVGRCRSGVALREVGGDMIAMVQPAHRPA
jgi:hypothetical protein